MPKRPHHPIRPEIEQEDEARQQFEADAISSQSNVLPLDAARNEGRFYGQLIRGERQLNGVQRVGFFLVGWIFCWWGTFLCMGIFPQALGFIGLHSPLSDKPIPLWHLPFAALVLLLGLKVMVTAVAPRRRKP